MATEVERLVVSLEASITKYERTMQRALGVTNSTMQRIEKRQQVAMGKTEAGWSAMSRGIASAFAGVAALRGAQQLIDASTRIENSLKVVGLEGEALTKVYDSLFASAQRNMAPIETLTTLYSRLGLAQKELGVTNDELLNFTDKVALALRVQGTTAQEARGALIQLSQAMGSGIVRAEEFNSVVEGAPTILRAAAAGLKEANGSVAALRKLVIDGKVSSEAFFRAFEAGSVILEDQVAGAEVTVSQQFTRLQNVLIDVAGKFNDTTGASGRAGQALGTLATFIENVGGAIAANKENIGWFIDKLGEAANLLPGFGQALKALENFNLSMDVELQTKVAEQQAARFAAETEAMFEVAISSATDMLDEWRSGWGETLPPEFLASVDTLLETIKEGGDEAKIAQAALMGLGATDTPFTEALGHLNALVAELQRVRGEANATAAAVAQAARPDVSGQPMSYAGQDGAGRPKVAPKTVSLADYAVPTTPGSGGRGGGGKSGSDRFADAVAAQERRIAALQRETALQSTLNPLINDYGYAVERLRAQMELENAAAENGLELTPERVQQIEALSSGYALATAEAARLAEAQDKVRETSEAMGQAARSALDTIIDGFIEGKDAGEMFGSVLKDLGRSLLNMGLSSFGSSFGGGNFLSSLFGGFRAGGGPVQAGKAYVVGEKRPELFVPGQSGTVIPLSLIHI